MQKAWHEFDKVTAGIAPSPYAGVGLNVIRAIASYAGKPVVIPRAGTHYPLTETIRYTIGPPGHIPLKPIRFSLVDVPDLKVLPTLWPNLSSVWMGAGPVPGVLHRALNIVAWGVRMKLLPSLSPLAPLMFWVINVLRWGEHRGGMFVSVQGCDDSGRQIERSWHMLAEGDDGPFIPSMAAEAIIRRCLEGRRPPAGARPATGDVELSDYEKLFARRRIVTGVREPLPASTPIHRRVLGEAWEQLPEPLRAMHDVKDVLTASGIAIVERGRGMLARLAGALTNFPDTGRDVPITVTFRRKGDREIWQRDFAGKVFTSTQEVGRGRFERLLCERFGPVAVGFALVVDGGRMMLLPRAFSFFGIRLPVAWAPGGKAYESVENGRFCFNVEIGHSLTGMIVRYRGWLVPKAD